jgi:hypothetical protein
VPLISTSGEVNGDDVIFDQSAIKGASRGSGIVAYFDYELGAGDSTINVVMKFNDSGVDANFYDHLAPALIADFNLPAASGKYRVKLPITLNEDLVKLTVTGLVDGLLNVEFCIDNSFITGMERMVNPVIYGYTAHDSGANWLDPDNVVDGDTGTYGRAFTVGAKLRLTENECRGRDLGTISKVELRTWHNINGFSELTLRPFVGGSVGLDILPVTQPENQWTPWVDLTTMTNAPSPWTWTDIKDLEMEFENTVFSGGDVQVFEIQLRIFI